MSNPFLALDLSDDENITVVKPAVAAPPKKVSHYLSRGPLKTNQPRSELIKEEQALQQQKRPGNRGRVAQPEVAHPGENSKAGVKKEQRPDSRKQDAPRRGREFERRSGTGRGREEKKGGAGGHNWGRAGEETTVPLPSVTPEPNAEAVDEAPVVEEDPSLTLEEYEKLRAQKRSGEAFEEKQARKVEAPTEGIVLKRDDDEDYIKLGSDDQDSKKKAVHKNKTKQVFEIDFKVRDTSADAAPPRRGGRPEGGRGREGAPRGGRGGAPRGAPRGGRGSAPGSRIDTADQSAFPKLGETA